MKLTWMEDRKFEVCRKRGFIILEWREADDDLTGNHWHDAWVVGSKIVVHAFVEHIVINPETMRKEYKAGVCFKHKSDFGDIVYCSNETHTELDLESALEYARWQATVVFRLIEGDDAQPLQTEVTAPEG